MSRAKRNIATFEFDLGDDYGCWLYAVVSRAINKKQGGSGPALPPKPSTEILPDLTDVVKRLNTQYLTISDSHKILDSVHKGPVGRMALEQRIEEVVMELLYLRELISQKAQGEKP